MPELQHLRIEFFRSPPVQAKSRHTFTNLPVPAFAAHQVDMAALTAQLRPYQKFKNIIIIANGGSRTSALLYYQSLAHLRNGKNIEFLSTMEPDVIAPLKKKYKPAATLIVPISKSGDNVDALEALLQFLKYTILPITAPSQGLLHQMAKKQGWDIVAHPDVGGRYSGRTACALAPALLMGLKAQKINSAALAAYASLAYAAPAENNPAFQAAQFCFELEEQGYSEIFMPVYSQALAGSLPLIVQLVHESTGKDGKGQTVFGDQAPESQHHTNQRFFGGQRNVLGCFTVVRTQRALLTTRVSKSWRDLPLRDGKLGDIDGVDLGAALRFDYEGVAATARSMQIPYFTLTIDEVNEASVGELLSFWHFYTVYSALLRGQDPFDQPQVEVAKAVSWQKRKTTR